MAAALWSLTRVLSFSRSGISVNIQDLAPSCAGFLFGEDLGPLLDRKWLPPPPRSPPPRSQGPQVGAPWEGHSGPPLTGPRSLCPVSGVANTAGALAGEKWAGVPCLQVSNPEFPGAPPHACVLPPAPLLRPSGWGVAPLGGSPQCQSSGGGGGEPRPQSWPGESTEPSSTVIMLPMACNRPQPRDPQM